MLLPHYVEMLSPSRDCRLSLLFSPPLRLLQLITPPLLLRLRHFDCASSSHCRLPATPCFAAFRHAADVLTAYATLAIWLPVDYYYATLMSRRREHTATLIDITLSSGEPLAMDFRHWFSRRYHSHCFTADYLFTAPNTSQPPLPLASLAERFNGFQLSFDIGQRHFDAIDTAFASSWGISPIRIDWCFRRGCTLLAAYAPLRCRHDTLIAWRHL